MMFVTKNNRGPVCRPFTKVKMCSYVPCTFTVRGVATKFSAVTRGFATGGVPADGATVGVGEGVGVGVGVDVPDDGVEAEPVEPDVEFTAAYGCEAAVV